MLPYAHTGIIHRTPIIHFTNKTYSTPSHTELIKAANMVFGTFEPHLLWDWLCTQIKSYSPGAGSTKVGDDVTPAKIWVASPAPTLDELLAIIDFLLEILSFVSDHGCPSSWGYSSPKITKIIWDFRF